MPTIRFDQGGVSVPVEVDRNGNPWFSRKSVSKLLGIGLAMAGRHMGNIVSETGPEHLRTLQLSTSKGVRDVAHYDLETVMEASYRSGTERSKDFRRWSTQILRETILYGISVDIGRLAALRAERLAKVVQMAQETFSGYLSGEASQKGISTIISNYSRVWETLSDYDGGRISERKGSLPAQTEVDIEACRKGIADLRKQIAASEPNVGMFGAERESAFERIVETLNQNVFGEALYPTVEERASSLLYFVIKDHPFSDGNKRIGSFLFLEYLKSEGCLLPEPETVSALALMVAGSEAREKESVLEVVRAAIPPRPESREPFVYPDDDNEEDEDPEEEVEPDSPGM